MDNLWNLLLGVAGFLYFLFSLKWETIETKKGLLVGVGIGILISVFSWALFKNVTVTQLSLFSGGLFTGILSIVIMGKVKNKPWEQSRRFGQGLIVGSWVVMMVLRLSYFFISG